MLHWYGSIEQIKLSTIIPPGPSATTLQIYFLFDQAVEQSLESIQLLVVVAICPNWHYLPLRVNLEKTLQGDEAEEEAEGILFSTRLICDKNCFDNLFSDKKFLERYFIIWSLNVVKNIFQINYPEVFFPYFFLTGNDS